VVRNGYLVREWYGVPAFASSTFDIWSCSKSLTVTAFGLLFDYSRNHKLPNDAQIAMDSRAYDFIPAGHPFSDPRNEKIPLRHLLTMTSGIPGENRGIISLSVVPGQGEFEFALGKQRDRFGFSAGTMVADPGKVVDHFDPAYAHLSLIVSQVARREIDEAMHEKIFRHIGLQNYVWNRVGGAGNLGPHTNAESGMHISARDLARFGYLVLRKGRWEGKQLIPQWWTDLATRSSQKLNPNYGFGWWVNTAGTNWPSVPKDAFALMGYASSRCYVVPSLDLVVVHLGFHPPQLRADSLLPPVVDSIIDSRKG
jgi:CubicO group peptidase (beta-lactamase class C family)